MLHYHGTPLTPQHQLARMGGRNFCVPYPRPESLAQCLRIGHFYAWIDPLLAHPHWAVVPDVIDGTVEEQRAMVATWPRDAAAHDISALIGETK